MTQKEALAARRQHNDAIRAAMPAGARFSGPRLDVFFEGWAKHGFSARIGHYWKRGASDDVRSLCGLTRAIERDLRGHLMLFEPGNFPTCAKCRAKRQRHDALRFGARALVAATR